MNKNMFEKLFWYTIGGALSIYLATVFVTGISLNIIPGQNTFFGIEFTQQWQLFFIVGGILGLINILIKPIISFFTRPLTILTLGLFPLVINMAILWFLDVLFLELVIVGIVPLFYTAIITAGVNFLLGLKK